MIIRLLRKYLQILGVEYWTKISSYYATLQIEFYIYIKIT